jgi:hypothetical protein
VKINRKLEIAMRFFLKRNCIALVIYRPVFRGAWHLATAGAIFWAAGTLFSGNIKQLD